MGGHGGQNLVEIERRIHGLDDLRHCPLLFERLLQLPRPLGNFLLEPGIGLLEPGGHVVEFIGEDL